MQKLTRTLLFVGDIVLLYASLIITLYIRYGNEFITQLQEYHLGPFTFIFVIWLIVFYIAGLYDINMARNTLNFNRTLFSAIITAAAISIGSFYLIPALGITPKTNLFIFILVFLISEYYWRRNFNRRVASMEPIYKLLLIGRGPTVEAIRAHLEENPQLGYEITFGMQDAHDEEFNHLAQIILSKKINLIAIPGHIKKDSQAARKIYQNLSLGIEVIDLADLYETIFKKVPLEELEEVWFLENLLKRHQIYETIKHPIEVVLAFFLFAALSPILITISLLIKISSSGPMIYKQVRVGQRGRKFTLYKFRTMQNNSEENGPQWSRENDKRITPVGKILRYSHLDELPQLINIIKSDIAFVGPRPERPEFVKDLEATISYYDIRHLIKPGLTGWAQINYRYGSSINDSYQKLQYDIYYLKNRSIILDIAIVTRTIKLFFINPE